ncbi:cell division protein FtsL [Rhodobacteraceae bacterium nBUS_24]|nr:cell division protein FtsL [Paracoccaceae bacterium]
MRGFLYALTVSLVMGLAYWAYQENIKTQAVLSHVEALQDDIGHARARLKILRAEWAYQNRPERLQDLADLNYDGLKLLPLSADHFGRVDQVGFPELPLLDQEDLKPLDVATRRIGQ